MACPPLPATLLASLGHYADPASGSLVPPIQPGVTALGHGPEELPDMAGFYARSGNAAADLAEALLARLEGAAATACFSAGAAAAQAVLAGLRPGDHLLLEAAGYYEFREVIGRFCARWGIAVTLVEMTDLAAVAAALRPGQTRLAWAELPTNPLWRVPDIACLAKLVHGAGGKLLVDATVATPVLARPIALGADWVLHSATKYLNGHGDLVAGALSCARADDDWAELLRHRTAAGTLLPPFEAWLLLRGLRTLALRVEAASRTALRLATWLAAQPAVRAVHYPGLPAHPQHALAAAQLEGGFGAMLSFQIASGRAAALRVAGSTKIFRRATSLGSTESLIEHRRSTEGDSSLCPDDLLRLSIGIEHADDLQADLAAALRAA
ncbi:trans-sulfuration enzyme family protein [Roseomonas sp. USHLN139]|uniref:trans-sulfuration enzyme family protein n=1 Tax=Roseomonas sp. USHLN139 TaxID=3081298 RepID=UPI003B02EAEE